MEHTDCKLICIKKSPNRKSEHQEAPSRTKQKKKKEKKDFSTKTNPRAVAALSRLETWFTAFVNSKTYEKNIKRRLR